MPPHAPTTSDMSSNTAINPTDRGMSLSRLTFVILLFLWIALGEGKRRKRLYQQGGLEAMIHLAQAFGLRYTIDAELPGETAQPTASDAG